MAERRTVGAMLKAYRNIYSVSIDYICEIGSFSKSTITKLEMASHDLYNAKAEESQCTVTVKMCEKLAKCMGMKLSEFFCIAETIEREKDAEFNVVVYLELSKYLLKRQRME